MHIRTDDIVEVITGEADEIGQRRKVLKVLRDEGKVLVEGINRAYRHIRRSQKNMPPRGVCHVVPAGRWAVSAAAMASRCVR